MVSRDEDHRHRAVVKDGFGRLNAIHFGHLHVENGEFKPFAVFEPFKHFLRMFACA